MDCSISVSVWIVWIKLSYQVCYLQPATRRDFIYPTVDTPMCLSNKSNTGQGEVELVGRLFLSQATSREG